jgi:hypothetical protein
MCVCLIEEVPKWQPRQYWLFLHCQYRCKTLNWKTVVILRMGDPLSAMSFTVTRCWVLLLPPSNAPWRLDVRHVNMLSCGLFNKVSVGTRFRLALGSVL